MSARLRVCSRIIEFRYTSYITIIKKAENHAEKLRSLRIIYSENNELKEQTAGLAYKFA